MKVMGSVYLILSAALLVYISPIIDGAATGSDGLVKATSAPKSTDSQVRARQLSPIEAYLPSDKSSDKTASLSTSQASSVATNNVNTNEATDSQSSGRNLYYPTSYAQPSYQQPQPKPQPPQQAYQQASNQPKQQAAANKQAYPSTAYNYGSPKQPAAAAYGGKASYPNTKAQYAADSYKSPRPLVAQPAGYGQKNPAKYKAILRQKGYSTHAADEIIDDIDSYHADGGYSKGHQAHKAEKPYKHSEYTEYPEEYEVPEHKHHHPKHHEVVVELPEPEKHHHHKQHHHKQHHHEHEDDHHQHKHHGHLKGKVHVDLALNTKPTKKLVEVVELSDPKIKHVKDGENSLKTVIKFNAAHTAVEPIPAKVFRPDSLGEPNLLSNLQNGLQRVKVKLHEQQVGRIDFDSLRQIRQILHESLVSAKILLEELDDLLAREGESPSVEDPHDPDHHSHHHHHKQHHHKHHHLLDEVGLVPNGIPVTEFTNIIEGEYDDNPHVAEKELEDAFEDEPEETAAHQHQHGSSARGLSEVAELEQPPKREESKAGQHAPKSPAAGGNESKARTEEEQKTEKQEALSHIEAPSPLSLHMPGGGTLVPDMNDWSKSLTKAINKSAKSGPVAERKAAKVGDAEQQTTVSTPNEAASRDDKTASAAATRESADSAEDSADEEQEKEFGLPSGKPMKNFLQPFVPKIRPTNKIVDEIGSMSDNSLIMMGDLLTPAQLIIDGLKANIDRIANDLKDGRLVGTKLKPSMILRAAERRVDSGKSEKAKSDKKRPKKLGAAKKAELEAALEREKEIEELEKKAQFEVKDKKLPKWQTPMSKWPS